MYWGEGLGILGDCVTSEKLCKEFTRKDCLIEPEKGANGLRKLPMIEVLRQLENTEHRYGYRVSITSYD